MTEGQCWEIERQFSPEKFERAWKRLSGNGPGHNWNSADSWQCPEICQSVVKNQKWFYSWDSFGGELQFGLKTDNWNIIGVARPYLQLESSEPT